MVVFLFIGSGELQPWAKRHPAQPTIVEEIPLAGKDLLHAIEMAFLFFFQSLRNHQKTNFKWQIDRFS